MTTATRIYRVIVNKDESDQRTHLVRATSLGHAVKHIFQSQVAANIATQDELLELAGCGTEVENAVVHTKAGRPKQKAA